METILNLDTELLLFLNSFHSEYFDWFMSMVTRREIWLPFYLSIGYTIFKSKGRVAFLTLIFIILVPSLSDLLNQHIFKPYFDRLRPFHVEELKNQLHVFNENPSGRRGFMSAHAMNSFGLATFCILLFKKKVFTLFIILWALLSSYSRIYLGFHYPGDVFCGMLVGILIGWMLYLFYKKIIGKKSRYYLLRNADYNMKPIIIVGLVIIFCCFVAAYHNYIFIEEYTRRVSKLKI
ncbi:undecaprenyl-diphosphatase [Balneicella halophila]|uniref:Undecaprenyl-diphosphatase n=1 Tax=Balneicella halophila TaxID=1537566 RepID=A0A7L4UTG2_BALHA|nr:phosphatase PAP2 family protein [Balneicella halophila]PVX52424.1 undecaprenyl-diphosphatase [Balneicella halophila]